MLFHDYHSKQNSKFSFFVPFTNPPYQSLEIWQYKFFFLAYKEKSMQQHNPRFFHNSFNTFVTLFYIILFILLYFMIWTVFFYIYFLANSISGAKFFCCSLHNNIVDLPIFQIHLLFLFKLDNTIQKLTNSNPYSGTSTHTYAKHKIVCVSH